MYIHYTHAAVIWPAYWKRGAFVVQTPQRIAYCVYMYVCMYIYIYIAVDIAVNHIILDTNYILYLIIE